MRRTITRAFCAIACLVLSCVALYGFLVLPLPTWRVAMLPLLVIGGLAALVGGWLFGRFLSRAVVRGGWRLAILPAEALVAGSAGFCFLSSYGGYPVLGHSLFEALIAAVFVAVVTANSYAVGYALLSRRSAPAPRRRVWALFLLYGSILAGFILIHVFPPPWGKVPPYPAEPLEFLSFAEYIEEARTRFPPEYTVEEDGGGVVRIRHGGAREPSLSEKPFIAPSEDIVVAEGSKVVFPEGTVEVLGLEIYCWEPVFMHPDGEIRRVQTLEENLGEKAPGEGRHGKFSRVGFWRADGGGVPEEEWPRELEFSGGGFEVAGLFLLELQGNIPIYRGPGNAQHLVLMPWEVPTARCAGATYPFAGEEEEQIVRKCRLHFLFGLPVPGPLELRVAFVRAEQREYRLAKKEGAVVHMERDDLQLLKLVEGDCSGGYIRGDRVYQLRRDEQAPAGEQATAVLYSLVKPYQSDGLELGIRAVIGGGEVLRPLEMRYAGHFIRAEFGCLPEAIRHFLVVERPHVTQIRFPVTDIPFFPPENYGLDNLLDLRVPYMVRHGGYVGSLFRPALGSRCESVSSRYRGEIAPGASLREILDTYRRSGWTVEKQAVRSNDGWFLNFRGRLLRLMWSWGYGRNWVDQTVGPLPY